jgi:hypothetical protein
MAACAFFALAVSLSFTGQAAEIPLPEHPRPDFERRLWLNLNGSWSFRFDREDQGQKERWFAAGTAFPDRIQVPFPWGSALSGVSNQADIAWYQRTIKIPEAWGGQRIFLVVGASDWTTTGWLDGQELGRHRGGYTPFEFELTQHIKPGQDHTLALRVDDTPHAFKLEGKQGYGAARGIWQTVYLEARGASYVDSVQFQPDLQRSGVQVKVQLDRPLSQPASLRLSSRHQEFRDAAQPIAAGKSDVSFFLPLENAHLWSLEDPFLYDTELVLSAGDRELDRVSSYFGMRQISVERLPGSGYPYIALNQRPVYLQITLDQSYHPEGFYTFPTDEFMRDEILRTRRLGLNAQRLHVKIDVPRKLYWADRLGILLMADVPNSWGEPDADMRQETEYALRQMIRRDFNHPAIFSWVTFNETWGLSTKGKGYSPETQEWVSSVYHLAKSLDQTRLVEDNSPCNYDHVVTDINSWHTYLPGYSWLDHLNNVVSNTYAGSTWNYIGGRKQGDQPLLNSECGNVWGYEGSTGDVDWSWDYHIMMNQFRRHPKVCGWLYTEHHDVINEWNGYYRFNRGPKYTGLDAIMPGMSLSDLHSPIYLAPGVDLCFSVAPGAKVEIPLWLSVMTDRVPDGKLELSADFYGWNRLGQARYFTKLLGPQSRRMVNVSPWFSGPIEPMRVTMPSAPGLAVLGFALADRSGTVYHRNFTTFRIASGPTPRDEQLQLDGGKARLIRFAPASFSSAKWSLKQWNVLDGLKVNGAGYGYFEYRLPWPSGLKVSDISQASLRAELGAKQLWGKDRVDTAKMDGDYMRGQGTFDPSRNPNAYPMTDSVTHPSAVRIRLAGESAGVFELPNDPADHRGILSWHAQLRDRMLREAGSYGYLVSATLPTSALEKAALAGEIVLRFEVDDSLPGGLAIYGENFGRYPLDPTLVFRLKP